MRCKSCPVFFSSLLEAPFWNSLIWFLPGVDLVPIKPLPNVVTIQEDITTERCRQVTGISLWFTCRHPHLISLSKPPEGKLFSV